MDWTRVRLPPKPHQIAGSEFLLTNPRAALFDDVGAGKSKQIIDPAFWLFGRGELDAVVAVAPGSARSVWADPDPVLGEVAKHGWNHTCYGIQEYHRKTKALIETRAALHFIVTNYEFLRRPERLEPLLDWIQRRRVWVIFDESWMIKTWNTQQTKAAFKLSRSAARVTLLNGTPGDPIELFGQFWVLNPAILGFKNIYTFRARHCIMGGFGGKQIVGYQNMEEFRAKIAPYALRRLTRDFFELGDPPVRSQIDVRLSPQTWTIYKEMRDNLVAWLGTEEASIAGQAGVKMLRLSQITAGFLGGVQGVGNQLDLDFVACKQVGSEKLDAVREYLAMQDPQLHKILLWGRFRPEIERLAHELQPDYPSYTVAKLYGGQSDAERSVVKRLLAPDGDPGPALIVGNPQSGGAGLNFAAAQVAIYVTNSFSLKDRLQSEGRLDRPGQTGQVQFIDVIAYGPDGQKTIDHHIVSSLRRKEDLSTWTAQVWRQKLLEE